MSLGVMVIVLTFLSSYFLTSENILAAHPDLTGVYALIVQAPHRTYFFYQFNQNLGG